jgi:hypothetical protein
MPLQLFTPDMYISILDKAVKDIYKELQKNKSEEEKNHEIQKIVNEVLGKNN